MNIHLHCLLLDGVYRRTEGEPAFQAARAPTRAELEGLLDKIIVRLMKMLTRQGHLVEEQGISYIADIDADNPLASLQAASCTYRIALGPRAGQKVLSLRTVPGRGQENHGGPVRQSARLQLACRGALWCAPAQGTRTAVSLYHAPGDRQRTAHAYGGW